MSFLYSLHHLMENYYTNMTANQGAGVDATGIKRIASQTTLFDGKVLNADDSKIWGNTGTGTGAFSNNTYTMSVTSGQYLIRASKYYSHYFSGKSQKIEITLQNFHAQSGVTKRVGYFSSNSSAPYDSAKDGFWLENDGSSIYLKISNAGTVVSSTAFQDFKGYNKFKNYDWSKFTVVLFDFLWLGGLHLRVFVGKDGKLQLLHEYTHAGVESGTIFKSPCQTVRYEIRGVSGSGTMTSICSQVSSEGSVNESGQSISVYNSTAISCSAVGTIYALKGLRKVAGYRDSSVEFTDIGAITTSGNDKGVLMLIANPTLSAPLSYAANSRFEEATATTQTITAGTGRVLYSIPISSSGNSHEIQKSYVTFMSIDITDTATQYVLAYMPITINQSVYGTINIREF